MLTFGDEIIYNLSALREQHAMLPKQIITSLQTDLLETTYSLLSMHHHTMHQQAFLLAKQQLEFEGLLPPWEAFCFVMLGSGARSEQALRVDQDHALIFVMAKHSSESLAQIYVAKLTELIAAYLYEIGYALCTGNVMASNPRWRGMAQEWSIRLINYQAEPTWENIRFLLIAADSVPIIGDWQLLVTMRKQAVHAIATSPFMRWKIADQGRVDKLVVPLWKRGSLSIKETLYTPLVNSVRLWAHSMSIEEPSTLERMTLLVKQHAWTEAFGAEAKQVFMQVLDWRVRIHVECLLRKTDITDMLNVTKLTPEEWERLKMAIRFVRKLQLLTVKSFHERGSADGV